MSKVTTKQVRDGLQKLFDAGPGVACSAFPLAQWIEALSERIAMDEAAQLCENCKGRREMFSDVHVRMMTCSQCQGTGKAPTAEPPAQPPIDLAAIREVIAYLQGGHRFDAEMADKLSRALGGTP